MLGRSLRPLNLDEFAAVQLHELLVDELENLRVELNRHRDNADRPSWGRVRLAIWGLHEVWRDLDWQLRELGDPSPEVLGWYATQATRLASQMPRSTANEVVWRRQKAEEREERERVLKARRAAKRGRSRTSDNGS